VAYAGYKLCAVSLDLHAAAAAEALLAAPELAIDGVYGYGYSSRQADQRCDEAFAVRLAGGLETKHEVELFILAE
jgi:hypothetical protein